MSDDDWIAQTLHEIRRRRESVHPPGAVPQPGRRRDLDERRRQVWEEVVAAIRRSLDARGDAASVVAVDAAAERLEVAAARRRVVLELDLAMGRIVGNAVAESGRVQAFDLMLVALADRVAIRSSRAVAGDAVAIGEVSPRSVADEVLAPLFDDQPRIPFSTVAANQPPE